VSAVTVQSIDEQLAHFVAECYADPLLHVLGSYPWGVEGTPLAGFTGPDDWQVEFLNDVGEQVKRRCFDGVAAVDPQQHSTASGHGIGKSAIVAWLIKWILDTRPDAKGVVTANTAEQLRTKTWAELAKWHRMSITQHWYRLNSGGGGSLNIYHLAHPETWRCDAQTCEERNSEAFAGLHAAGSTPFFIFDEASAIPDKIFEVREGGLTDGEPMTFDFGNPTRNQGRFYENMVGRYRSSYRRRFIDSRSVAITNKSLIKRWVKQYGEDSDFVRVRVKGEFPRAGNMQLIGTDLVEQCVDFGDVANTPTDPVVVSADIARFGSDRTVIRVRRGRDCTVDKLILRGIDTMQVAARIVEIARKHRSDAVFIDGGGVGGGVVDRCRQLGLEVIEVNFGSKAINPLRYVNMRAEMWDNLKQAMIDGILIEDDPDLRTDLTAPEYKYDNQQRLVLESKDDMRKRGLDSPDDGDALALSFCMPVYPSRPGYQGDQGAGIPISEYDPY